MTIASDVVSLAISQIGTTEDPPNSNCNPYSHELGRPCHYWCADFTAAMLTRTNADVPSGVLTASTRLNLSAWKQSHRFIKPADLQPGDIVFFHISGRNGNDPNTPDHTGVVIEAPRASRVMTVEGNTSDNDHGSQDNGGGVYARTRLMSVVIGGGRPYYDVPPPPIPQPEPSQEDDDMIHIYDLTFDNDPVQYARIGNVIAPITGQQKAELLEVKPKAVVEETVYGAEAWAAIVNLCTLKP